MYYEIIEEKLDYRERDLAFSNTTPPSANSTARHHWVPRQPLPVIHRASPAQRRILTVNIPPRAPAIFVRFNERKRLLTSLRRRGENKAAEFHTDRIH